MQVHVQHTGVGVEILDLATFSFKSITIPSCRWHKSKKIFSYYLIFKMVKVMKWYNIYRCSQLTPGTHFGVSRP